MNQFLSKHIHTKRNTEKKLHSWLNELRRRRNRRVEERRRISVWLLILLVLENIDRQMMHLIASLSTREDNSSELDTRLRPPPEKTVVPAFDISEHVRRDYASRRGEEHKEIMDGLTAADIQQIRDSHRQRPRIPGMPDRYSAEWPGVRMLLTHLSEGFLRKDAYTALKGIVPKDMRHWIEDCERCETGWKDLRMCMSATPDATIAAMRRAMWHAEQDKRRKVEEGEQNGAQILACEDLDLPLAPK
jgi:hypothetical protein